MSTIYSSVKNAAVSTPLQPTALDKRSVNQVDASQGRNKLENKWNKF